MMTTVQAHAVQQPRRKVPFDALPMHQCEQLIEAMRRRYAHDIENLILAHLRRHTADELHSLLDALDAA